MANRTPGGLLKRTHHYSRETLAAVQGVAANERISESAAVRRLIGYGYRVYQRARPITEPAVALAVESVAGEVGFPQCPPSDRMPKSFAVGLFKRLPMLPGPPRLTCGRER